VNDRIDELVRDIITQTIDLTQNKLNHLPAAHSALRAEFDLLQQELDDERAGRPLLAKATDRINDLQQELDAMTKERDTQRELIGRPAEAIYGEYHDMREELAALKERTGLCQWMYDDNGFWQTTCEEAFCIEDGTPKDNGMRFCVYCGKPLAEVIPPEDPENA